MFVFNDIYAICMYFLTGDEVTMT